MGRQLLLAHRGRADYKRSVGDKWVYVRTSTRCSRRASPCVHRRVGGSAAEVPQIPPPPDVAAAPADAVRTSTNLASKVIAPVPAPGIRVPIRPVTVHYTGWTTSGRTFDSSVTRGAAVDVRPRRGDDGWTEGVQMMVEGEKRRFWIPGRLAYDGVPGRPQGMLVFDIELIRIGS